MPVTKEHLETAKKLARQYGARRLILFGRAQSDPSAARDLDLGVEGVEGWKVWELAGRLERAIDVPLDLVPLDRSTPLTRRIKETGQELTLNE